MTPSGKTPLAIRLGLAASALAIGAVIYLAHRHSGSASVRNGSAPAAGGPGQSAVVQSSVAGKGTSEGRREGGSKAIRPAAPLEGCFTLTYHHKPLVSHRDEEACSRHRNLIRLKHAGVNGASVCIRVNGTPVKFQRVQGHPDEILIGAVAGPQSTITARYCIGKAKCSEDCTIPKDEFMEAIGGSDDDGDSGAPVVAQWDANDAAEKEAAEATAKLDSELKRELASEDADGRAGGTYVFQDWLNESDPTVACASGGARSAESRQARN